MGSEWPRARASQSTAAGRTFRPNTTTILLVVAIPLLLWLLLSTRPTPPGPHSLEEIKVDMHCHTTESDGDRTAEEQIKLAAKIGLDALWITDHDMIRDLPRTREIQRVAQKAGVEVSFGVEITVGWEGKEHHLLGYFPDAVWAGKELSKPMKALQVACAAVKDSRRDRNLNLQAFLNEVLSSEKGKSYFSDPTRQASFTDIDVDVVASWAKENANLMEPTSLGRPHFRAYLIEVVGVRDELIFGPRAGDGVAILTDNGEVFFDEERSGHDGVEIEALMHSATLAKRNIAFNPLPIKEAISLINQADGRAVLAHPPTLGSKWQSKFVDLVGDLAASGLWGIEAFSSEIDSENHLIIAQLAKEHGLVMTAGSDNHGSLKIYAHLGEVKRHGNEAYAELEYWARNGLRQSRTLRNEL